MPSRTRRAAGTDGRTPSITTSSLTLRPRRRTGIGPWPVGFAGRAQDGQQACAGAQVASGAGEPSDSPCRSYGSVGCGQGAWWYACPSMTLSQKGARVHPKLWRLSKKRYINLLRPDRGALSLQGLARDRGTLKRAFGASPRTRGFRARRHRPRVEHFILPRDAKTN
jgi:hypothetical protein